MWWGDEAATGADRANRVLLKDTNGKELPQQSFRKITYPFSDFAFTEHTVKLDQAGMTSWGVEAYQRRGVEAQLLPNGKELSRTITLPFQVVNMIGAKKVDEASVLDDTRFDIKKSLNVKPNMSTGDTLLRLGMELMASEATYNSNQDEFAVRLMATSDPTVFRAFFSLSAGNMSSADNQTGVYPTYSNMEDMAFAQTDSATKMGDLGLLPNPLNLLDMARGKYLDKMIQEGKDALAGKRMRDFSMDLGGYYEADIAYNAVTNEWECRPVSGGFHAGGGVGFTWNVNSMVGIVPVTMSMTLGSTVELRMDMQRGKYYTVAGGRDRFNLNDPNTTEETLQAELDKTICTEQYANDYLTSLRVFLYVSAFAGVGFDISVLAFKIGVFGQLNVDLNFKWLNRGYLEDTENISAAGPVNTRDEAVMHGQEQRFSGSTGIEFLFKFLFISYEQIFCSVGFEFDLDTNDWDTIDEIWAASKTINDRPIQRMRMPNGQVMYGVDLGPQLESRDYVDVERQFWAGGMPVNALNLDGDSPLPAVLQKGAYPYANPVLSDDGAVMLYLSDRGTGASASDVTSTRVAASFKSGGQFPEGSRFDTSTNAVPVGYGDSSVKVAGSGGQYAAVWVRQMENITAEAGSALTEGQQRLQMNSTEIVAAIYNDDGWELTRLTNNGSPDLAPVVATNGTYTVAAWREVDSSNADDLTNFDQKDAIRYSVYDGDAWGETQTLYDGAGGSVKGIEAAMLSDGTSAVVYTMDADPADGTNSDWETVAAIIPNQTSVTYNTEAADSEDTVRTFRLTSDTDLDENPQISAVKFGKDDTSECFIIAWHTERKAGAGGEKESDIRLAALDASGVLREELPESLGRATEGTGVTIGGNFRFAKNADTIEDLAILWVDSISADPNETEYKTVEAAVAGTYGVDTGYDVLKAVKFVNAGSSYTVSGAVDVASMEKQAQTTIDCFDAYVDGGDTVKSILLATGYSSESAARTVQISDGKNTTSATITVPVAVSGMYTATETFQNRIDLSAVMLDYKDLYLNSAIDAQFTIRNSGKDAITKLEIVPEGGGDAYYSTASDPLYNGTTGNLNLMPNRDITVTAKFPTGAEIVNQDYIIKATFGRAGTFNLDGTLYLDIPDVGISKVETVKEADGERVLRYSLYNMMPAKLADMADGWRVKIGFYTDQAHTAPFRGTDGQELVMAIDDADALALIDNGGYSAEVTIPIAAYAGEGQELPNGGIKVYAKAWIEQGTTNARGRAASYDTVTEYYDANNSTSLLIENLAQRRGEDVTIQHSLDNSGTTSVVTVNVLYNKLTGTESGNLIVTLLDENGQPIEKLQSYTAGGLLNLVKEGTAAKTFTFTKKGASVRVEFSDLILDSNSVELDHVILTGADIVYDADTKTYTATGANLTSGVLDIAPKDPKNAAITVNGASFDITKSETVKLPFGTTRWVIKVVNGGASAEYTLVLTNTDTTYVPGGGGGWGSTTYPVETPDKADHGSVAVKPSRAEQGDTVTITAKPDTGYQVGRVTVTKANGDPVAVAAKGGGIYTFVMPNSKVMVTVTFIPQEDWSNPFVDVPHDAYYANAVIWAVKEGITSGSSATTFNPNGVCTRAQAVTFLWRAAGSPAPELSSMPFTDVAADAYYCDAVRWAVEKGITSGTSNTTFSPNATCTRAQIVTFLWRAEGSEAAETVNPFSDVAETAYYSDAVLWAVEKGITAGTSSTTFSPSNDCTRAQIVTFIFRSAGK